MSHADLVGTPKPNPPHSDIVKEYGSRDHAKQEPSGEAGPSTRYASPEFVRGSYSRKLSFFEDCDIIDGMPRRTLDLSCAVELYDFKFSRNNRKMAARDISFKHIWIFDLLGRAPPEAIDLGHDTYFEFCFQSSSDDVIFCGYKNGRLMRWERREEGHWAATVEYLLPFSVLDGIEFSSNGRYLAVTCTVDGRSVIVWYNISGIQDPPQHITRFELDRKGGESCALEFSPSGRGFLLSNLNKACTIVWPDYATQEVAFELIGNDGHWFGDRVIVTKYYSSFLWEVDSLLSSVAWSPAVGSIVKYGRKPNLDLVSDKVISVNGSRVLLYHDTLESMYIHSLDLIDQRGGVDCGMQRYLSNDFFLESEQKPLPACTSENGRWIAVLEVPNLLSVWDAEIYMSVWTTHLPDGVWRQIHEHLVYFGFVGNDLVIASGIGEDRFCHVYRLNVLGARGDDPFNSGTGSIYEMQGNFGSFGTFSSDGSKFAVGCLDHLQTLKVWSLTTGALLELVSHGEFCAFSFSMSGDRVITVSEFGKVALWNLEGRWGTMTDCQAQWKTKDLGIHYSRVVPEGVSFTMDKYGQHLAVLLVSDPLMFVWCDLRGQLVSAAKIGPWECNGLRFSSDGEQCVILCGKQHCLKTEVWDLVNRQRLQVSPFRLQGQLCTTHFQPEQLSVDGNSILLGVNGNREPWVITCNDQVDDGDFKAWKDCAVCDYGECNIAGPLGSISEDGQHVVLCTRTGEDCATLAVHCATGKAGQSFSKHKTIDFTNEGEILRLTVSSNGQYIALVSECNGADALGIYEDRQRRIRVWTPLCDDQCIPTYHMLQVRNQTSDPGVLMSLLDRFGMNLLTLPNGDGWMLLARAIEDGNTDWVRMIVEWAKENNEHIPLNRSDLIGQEGGGWANLLELALDRQLPECVQNLLDGSFDGTLVAPNKEEVLGKVLGDMAKLYPGIVSDTLSDSRMLQEVGEVRCLQSVFQDRPFVAVTHRKLKDMTNREVTRLWTESPVVAMYTGQWSHLKNCMSMGKLTGTDSGKKVLARSSVVPIADFARVGGSGLLSRMLVKGMGEDVFRSLPMKAVIDFKWAKYAQQLVLLDLYLFSLLLSFFTVYSLFIGMACRHSHGLSDGYGIACAVFLVLAMAMGVLGLYGELRQMRSYWQDGRGLWFYWRKSKWNSFEFIAYILIVLVIPAFHFATDPCSGAWGISWAVPIVDILLWWKLLYYAQAFRNTGPMVLMIFAIMQDILFFLFIGLGLLLGFGMGFFVLFRADDEETFSDIGKSLLATFAMMLGDFDLGILYNSHAPEMAVSLFVVYIWVMAIVLLNLLIAIMGDSYDRIKESAEQHFYMVRAAIIDDMEAMLSNRKKEELSGDIGPFLHVLVPKDRMEVAGQWRGRMLELKNHYEKISEEKDARQQQRQDVLERIMKQKFVDIEASMAEQARAFEERLDRVEESRTEQNRAVQGRIEALENTMNGKVEILNGRFDELERMLAGG